MLRSRLFAEWCLTLLVTLALTAVAVSFGLTQRLDLALQDWAVSFSAEPPQAQITLVEIDDVALRKVGPWPWSRETQAQLIEAIAQSGPAAIALDVLLIEPSDGDEALAGTIAESGNVLLPHTFGTDRETGNYTAIYPAQPLRSVAAATGHVELLFEDDGAVRQLAFESLANGRNHPHFMLETYRFALGEEPARLSALVDPTKPLIFPYHGTEAFTTVSAADFFDGTVADPFMRDGIVLIGATAQGLSDSYAVPAYGGGILPGVEIQANFLDAMVQDSFVTPVSTTWSIILTALAVLALFLAFWAFEPARLWRVATLVMLLIFVVSLVMPRFFGIWFPPSAILVAFVIAYPFWGWRRLSSVVNYMRNEASNLQQFDNSKDGIIGAGFDDVARHVSQLRGLVANVRERFEFIRSVVIAAPEPIVVLDDKGLSRIMNKEAQTLFDGETLGFGLTDLLASQRASFNEVRKEIEFPNGRVFRFSRSEIADGDDGSIGEIVQFYEFTQIRAAEKERRETMEFLSHDMRSPQVAIIGLAEGEGQRLSAKERFQRIVMQANRTLKLADDFVQIARLSARPVQLVELDLSAQVIEAADRFYYQAQKKKIALVQNVDEDPIFVMGDPAMLARMVDNLLSNAIKFSPDGSEIELTAGLFQDDPTKALLSVKDNGPGLPPERIEKPFARFGASSDTAGPSAGLGLTFVNEAVRQHQGEITVETHEGIGTTFSITLPLA